jgi:hypothetical protein
MMKGRYQKKDLIGIVCLRQQNNKKANEVKNEA